MFIKIGGQTLPPPTKYNVIVSDLDSSDTTRNEAGELVRNRVRGGVIKIELTFIVKGSQVAQMLELIEPAQVDVSFLHPRFSGIKSIKAYSGDRTVNMQAYDGSSDMSSALWEVSFNLIEY